MCLTEYVADRAREIERTANERIEVVDFLIPHVIAAQARAGGTSRPGALLTLLIGMHAELVSEKAAALRVIEDAVALRRARCEVQS
jgi:hypothetical protein